MKASLCILLLLTVQRLCAQQTVKGVVADSLSRQPLPFATAQAVAQNKAVLSGIDGRFALSLSQAGAVRFSYSGYAPKTLSSTAIKSTDTVFLSPLTKALEAVVIRSNNDKIRRLLNLAIVNKPANNPEQYDRYECSVYYKMAVDITPFGNHNFDSIRRRQDSLWAKRSARRPKRDTSKMDTAHTFKFAHPSHVFLTESFSRRAYKKPQQVQEVVLAAKTSGLRKTWFANIVTDVLPFHVYGDFILLNNTDYANPVAKGWQSRYRFTLEDEVMIDGDTVFILRYVPKPGTSFNSLTGLVYINSNSYAVSHFTGTNNANANANRVVKFEHTYRRVAGRWFPQELNYDFAIRRFPFPYAQVVWNGHSVVDSVTVDKEPSLRFDKARSVKLSDSVDSRTTDDWRRYRKDTLTLEEANTYRNMDSIVRLSGMESFIEKSKSLATGRFPLGKVDVDLTRLLAANQYEGTRLGIGLYTNDKIWKHVTLGGWWGYGFRDKAAKWGASMEVFPGSDRESSITLSYQKNIRLTGEAFIHPELSATALRNWLLQKVDAFNEYALSAKWRAGYWELRPAVSYQQVGPLQYGFAPGGKNVDAFSLREASLGLRYAYAERRVPFFEAYVSQGTRYPIVYANLGYGQLRAGGQQTDYLKLLAAVTYSKHFNRWGDDRFWLEAGWVRTNNDEALPRSLLLSGRGFKTGDVSFYAWGGFLTMKPFEFYSDRYASLFYKHDFDKNLWNLKWSKPFLSLAHNAVYGGLRQSSLAADAELKTYASGYHESGLLVNRLLRRDLKFLEASLNAGCFYHWQKNANWRSNAVAVIGFSAGF